MRKILAILIVAVIGMCSAARAQEALPPIQKVQISKDGHFLVNGKPFFPLMSWDQSPSNYPKLREVGINTHAGDPDPALAKAAGAYAVTNFKPQWAGSDDVLAWFYGDEPDMESGRGAAAKPRTAPEIVAAECQRIKAADPSRPLLINFTGSFTTEETHYAPDVRARIYPLYIQNADGVGFDIYPIYGSGYAAHLNWVGNGVAELRALAGPKRPVWAWIETCKGSQWMRYNVQPDVLPIHTRNEVWQAIVNGASAIGYFTHAWQPAFKEFAPTDQMQQEMKRLDAQITRLAPAILAEPPAAAISMKLGDNLLCQFKATELDGVTFIFALNRDLGPGAERARQFDPIQPRPGQAIFTVSGLKAGTMIEVVDENRSIKAQEGAFEDEFEPLAEHIYKLKL